MSYTINDIEPLVTVTGSSINVYLRYTISSGYSIPGGEFQIINSFGSIVATANGANNSYTFTNIPNGNYRVRVFSLTIFNMSNYQTSFDYTERNYQTFYTVNVVYTPTDLSAISNSNNITLTFSQIGSVTNYKYSLDNGATYTLLSPAQTTSPIVLTNPTIQYGVTYQIKLIAVEGTSESLPSETVTGKMPLPSPASLVATANMENTSISITFTQIGSVTNYKYSLDNGATYTLLSPAQTTSPIVLNSPLVNKFVPYEIKLKAVYNTEESVESEMVSIEIPCLLKGMKIKMSDGLYRKVEDVKEGDFIKDLLGRNIEVKKVFSVTLIGNEKNIPYVIPKDSFEKDVPNQDVYLSYNHAFYYLGWKIPIHTKILKQDKSFLGKEITYYHFQLPDYEKDKLMCHGLPVDSYEDNKDLI